MEAVDRCMQTVDGAVGAGAVLSRVEAGPMPLTDLIGAEPLQVVEAEVGCFVS